MKIKIDEICFDEEIYPRQKISWKTVNAYVEALKGGAVFPPIEVQRLRYKNGEVKVVCLDGKHRILAITEFNKLRDGVQPIHEIEAKFWKDDILDRGENLEELRIRSAILNRRHGDRLTQSDLAAVVLRIIRARPIERLNGVVTELAKKLGYAHSYISSLETEEGKVSDILAKRRLSRDFKIWRLLQLGYTQSEAGAIFGLKQRSVSDISENVSSYIITIQQQFARNHKSVEEIAKFNNLDIITTWSMVLQGKDDLERFKLFGKPEYQNTEPRYFNVWNFTRRDPRLGMEYPGNIPGQIVMNILYYYTSQGALVVDPMAGGGSTIDVCLIMNRRCRAYDINPIREDIIKYDIKTGFPEKTKNCDLIFLDPPYWRLKMKEYNEIQTYESWLWFMKNLAEECFKTVKLGGYVALILEPFFDRQTEKRFLDLPFVVNKLFLDCGFNECQRIQVPLAPETSAHGLEYGRKGKIILDQARDLIIYQCLKKK